MFHVNFGEVFACSRYTFRSSCWYMFCKKYCKKKSFPLRISSINMTVKKDVNGLTPTNSRSNSLELFLGKGILKIRSKFTGEHWCGSAISLQLYLNRTSVWVFSYKFAAYFQNTFSYKYFWRVTSIDLTGQQSLLLSYTSLYNQKLLMLLLWNILSCPIISFNILMMSCLTI